MKPEQTVTLMPDITYGNATIVGTETGWALPGRKETRNEAYAKMMARRMARLMTGLEVGK